MPSVQTKTLELENEAIQRNHRREWFAERCGMVLVATVLFAALTGLLGPGLLSHQVTRSDDGLLSAEHDKVQRYQSPTQLRISCRASSTGVMRLHLSRSFTDRVVMDQIAPQPESMELTENHIIFSFRATDLPRDGMILFRFKHDEYGTVRYAIQIEHSKIQLTEFVLP